YSTLGGITGLNGEYSINVFGKPFGLWGTHGFFLSHGGAYDVGAMVMFLFQMVFMDTALTIVTGSCAERWKFAAFAVSSVFVLVLTGCFILAFGWFGFNPGSTLAASGNGALRIASIAVNTMLAGCTGSFGAILYMWMRYGKPDASMAGNGLLAGLVAITAPSGFVNPLAACIIGWAAGIFVCLAVEFFDRIPKVDDPVGAISVHGVNGLWGVLSVGLFADGTANYGGSWNGVSGNVAGLLHGGGAGQLVAQIIGCLTLLAVAGGFSQPFLNVQHSIQG